MNITVITCEEGLV